MTKLIICAAALAVSALSAQAQEKKFEFGVKAGAQLSTFAGDFEEAEALAGFHVGGLVNYHFNENFSVQPELLLSMQGAESGDEYWDGEVRYENMRVELFYLNMPVLVKYHFAKVRGLSVGAGPQVGVLLSAKQKYDSVVFGDRDENENDIKDDVKPIDIGLVGDVEYKLKNDIFFSVRANVGFVNINDDGSNDKTRNSVVSLSAGYRF
ncbi:porin family protein [Flavobacterium selenitireducens]|uniref:porin family protein n=1 Tax=Flavobacterium selenitireducens TaxID=2722704 RepID=UPI00168B4E1D|nr:porin family protein [Flavobacterium selenitireducens]MBD3581998.1 PorT family protein [Flavobacterium selenitireducens]